MVLPNTRNKKTVAKKPAAKSKATQPPAQLTLKDAIAFLNAANLADQSKKLYAANLADIVFFSHGGLSAENTDVRAMTTKELQKHYADENIAPLLNDFEKVVDIVQNKRVNKKNPTQTLSLNSTKGYYLAVLTIARKGGCLHLPAETLKKYENKHDEQDLASKEARAQNPVRNTSLRHPGFNWDFIVNKFDEWLADASFSNTATGRTNLRNACLLGLYILQVPRRVKDYQKLQYYSKLPSDANMADKNILLVSKGKATLYIDDFKTRWLARKKSRGERKEVLPRFVKDLSPRLTSLFVDYISKAKIVDNAKSPGKPCYMFHTATGEQHEQYAETGFSKYITSVIKSILKIPGISANDFRHEWQDWLAANLTNFTDAEMKAFSYEFGDKNLLTALGYRQVKPVASTKTQKINVVLEQHRAVRNILNQIDDADSVGGGEEEINSPENNRPMANAPVRPINAATMPLYAEIGRAFLELRALEDSVLAQLRAAQ